MTDELPDWPPADAIADWEREQAEQRVLDAKATRAMFAASDLARDNRDNRIAAANARVDAVAECGEVPEFIEINETNVYRVEREPGFPTETETACVRLIKKMDDGREWQSKANDDIDAYSVTQNRDGTYSCDCGNFVFVRSKVKDQRTDEAKCKHISVCLKEGIFKTEDK